MDHRETRPEMLEKWFRDRIPGELEDGSEYPLLLLATGIRPAALTMNVDENQVKLLREFAAEFDLAIHVSEGRVSKPGREIVEKRERAQKAAFLAESEERFDKLEPGRFYGHSDLSVGRFLDFPEKSVKFFADEEQPSMVSRKWILENADRFEDLELLNLVTYVPAPDPESVERAVKNGRERREQLLELDRESDFSLGEDFIRQRLSVDLYTSPR